MPTPPIVPTLANPLDPPEKVDFTIPGEIARADGAYEEAMREGWELVQRPVRSVPIDQIEKQHQKGRMTVWEKIRILTDEEPNVLFTNWGKNLDGASLVTAVLRIGGRDVACYGHDFTVRGRWTPPTGRSWRGSSGSRGTRGSRSSA
jgi:acetyl-CoA carboxylase carboxyltransferase component